MTANEINIHALVLILIHCKFDETISPIYIVPKYIHIEYIINY